MRKRYVWRLALVAGALAGALWADEVVLDNGSRLVGTVSSIAPGKIALTTDFAGTLNLDARRVVEITAEKPMNVAFTDGHRASGTLAVQDGGAVLRTAEDVLPIADIQAIKAAWAEGQPDPTAKPATRTWAHELGADLTGKSGNSRKARLGGAAKSVLSGPDDKTTLYLRGATAEEDGKETEDELIGGADYERVLSKKHTWYARGEAETDGIETLDLRATVATGYGYYFLKEEKTLLRGRAGVQYRHEDYESGRSEDTVAAEFGLRYELALRTWAKLVSEITYAPAFDNPTDEYRIDHTTGLDVPLDPKQHWSLRLGVTNSYNSTAAAGLRELETTYLARLVLKLP